jgi:serine/threonine protein kinase
MIKRRIEKEEKIDNISKWVVEEESQHSLISIIEDHTKKENKQEAPATSVGMWRDKHGDLLPDVLVNERTKRAYTIVAQIGKGGYGHVFLGTRFDNLTRSQWRVALKVVSIVMMIEKNQLHWIKHEVANHQLCCRTSIYILKCYETFRNAQNFCFVMEYANTNMQAFILKKKRMDVDDIRRYFSQMVSAVVAVHRLDVIHHDIKPENFLMVGDLVKLTDFGVSWRVKDNVLCESLCGTPRYMAPEIVEVSLKMRPSETHSFAVDIWSLGVTLYLMATGSNLFNESTDERYKNEDTVTRICRAVVESPIVFPDDLHPLLRDLLEKLLQRDPLKRPSAQEVLKHDFFTFIIDDKK